METDYLIAGAGASALSFLDVLLAESDAEVVIVDRRDAAGGHWNDAYDFVRLHQSASFYGVNSRHLGAKRTPDQDITDPTFELSGKAEILHYFHSLMAQYIATGRVTFLRNSEYLGDGRVRHLITGAETQVTVRRKIVNAGMAGEKGSIPATHTPSFEIAPEATCVPINDLPRRAQHHNHFVIIGAGKTGMDAAMWLLDQGVTPDHITWVRPNDYWLFKRETILNHPDQFTTTIGAFLGELETLGTVSNVDEFCAAMESQGTWHRIDPEVTPTRFHAAVCSTRERDALAQIDNVVRKGHVTRLEQGQMQMQEGTVDVPKNSLYIDCSARAGVIVGRVPRVFSDGVINLNMIRPFQPMFGAALIAFLETNVPDEDLRAACTNTVDFHNTPAEYIAQLLPAMINQGAWARVPEVREWMSKTRLQAVNHLMKGIDPEAEEVASLLKRFGPAGKAAIMNIPNILNA